VSFNDKRTFPLLKRATAIGICNFCARLATVFSPFVAELDTPWPISIIIIVTVLALIVSITFPSREEEL